MKRILLIDDDQDILDMMQAALTYYGYAVKSSHDPEDIRTLVTLYNPDIIIIDYLLKGINGGEHCSILKKSGETRSIPIIIMSAYHRVIHSLGNYGSDAFLAKPFDLQELLENISRLLKKPVLAW